MLFDILLYASLIVCITGICYNIYLWTRNGLMIPPESIESRLPGAVKQVAGTIFSRHLLSIIRSFITDVLLLGRTFKTSRVRWLMHTLIFAGFAGLVLMHAMDSVFTEKLFPYYYSTLNPFFFLRSLFGLMVLFGIAIALSRRYFQKIRRLRSSGADLFLIVLVLVIVLSGVLLEGMKMASVKEFTVMVEDYAGLSYDDEEVEALEAYWVKDFALVSGRVSAPFDPEMIEMGMEAHEASCVDCHDPNRSAFLGYAAAKLLTPVALVFDRLNMVTVFYYLHIIACFAGLALIPFGKMFHVVAAPVSLLTRSATPKNSAGASGSITRQMMGLSACTHCGTCNLHCSAGIIRETVPNDYILPSEKMQALKKTVSGRQKDPLLIAALFQGIYLCTSCDRCTVVCPSGIDLKSLWLSVREALASHCPEDPVILTGFSFIRKINRQQIWKSSKEISAASLPEHAVSPIDRSDVLAIDSAAKNSDALPVLPPTHTFANCFGCQNCSTICPVVALYESPEEHLTLMPHQIMYSLGLGLTHIAQETAMLYNCLSCYQCQEHCPQGVSVCDILFLLKNRTFKQVQDKPS